MTWTSHQAMSLKLHSALNLGSKHSSCVMKTESCSQHDARWISSAAAVLSMRSHRDVLPQSPSTPGSSTLPQSCLGGEPSPASLVMGAGGVHRQAYKRTIHVQFDTGSSQALQILIKPPCNSQVSARPPTFLAIIKPLRPPSSSLHPGSLPTQLPHSMCRIDPLFPQGC